MRGLFLVLQILISLITVALAMPVILFAMPAAQNRVAGPAIAVGMLVVVFLALRWVWPSHRP
jgi:hypothetical protein